MKEVKEAKQLLPDKVEVGGRVFIPTANTTFDQDLYLMSLMTETGLARVARSFDKDMILSDVAQEIITVAYNSGKLFLILAGGMVEEGKKWNKAESVQLAQWFADLSDPDDKAALHGIIATAILGFFLTALSSLRTSENSGQPKSPEGGSALSTSGRLPTSAEQLEQGLGLAATAYQVEEPTTSQSGTTSSES